MYKRFDKTPREIAIRQLFWTLLAVSSAALINLRFIPFWIPILVIGLAIWRYWVFTHQYKLPNKLIRFILSICAFVAIAMSYQGVNGVQAGTALLTLMSAIKLTETKGRRDCVVLLFISYFQVMASFLFDQSILAAALALPTTILITGALLRLSESPTPRSIHKTVINASKRLAQAVPIMLVLFVLFPRIPGPFWSLPTPSNQGRTGLSDTMQPGSLSDLIQSPEVAFRVEFESEPPPPEKRYWRGISLDAFDGRTWRASKALPLTRIMHAKNPVDYTITIQPHEKTWLFGMHLVDVERLPTETWMDHTFQLHDQNPIYKVKQYRLRSYLNYQVDANIPAEELKKYLALPPQLNPKTRELTSTWTKQTTSLSGRVEKAYQYFAQEPFYYTLKPPQLTTLNGIDEFLFSSRRGFCEHYSSSFVVMMRMMNIPARVVTGYQGGEINPRSEHLTVRQSDAHAWTEVWLPRQGWIRVDPTQAVAPSRIEQGIEQSLSGDETLPSLILRDNAVSTYLRHSLDSLNNNWNQWVLGFEQGNQMRLLQRLGVEKPTLMKLIYFLIIAMLIVVGTHYWYSHRSRQRRSHNPLEATYRKLCRHLAKAGAKRRAYEGPSRYGERAGRLFPNYKGSITQLMNGYAQYCYYPDQGELKVSTWKKLAKAFLSQNLPPADAEGLVEDQKN